MGISVGLTGGLHSSQQSVNQSNEDSSAVAIHVQVLRRVFSVLFHFMPGRVPGHTLTEEWTSKGSSVSRGCFLHLLLLYPSVLRGGSSH